MPRRARFLVAATLAVALALTTSERGASAHTLGLSSGEYEVRGSRLEAKLVFARAELVRLVPLLDANRDGHVSAAEVREARPQIRARVLDRIEVSASGRPCPVALTDAGITEQDGLLVAGRWDCGSASPSQLSMNVLEDMAREHRHVARLVRGGETSDRVVSRDARTLPLGGSSASGDAGASAGGDAGESPPAPRGALAFVGLGFVHVITGWDHLLFLLALVAVRTRTPALVRTVTAFTLAHSVTLALAALAVVTPPSRLVEPLVALSIAVVALSNLRGGDGERRWRLTAAFGLVHGFGFAGALRDLALAPGRVVPALLAFNVGVELAQLAALGVLVPLLGALRRRAAFEPHGARGLSIALAAVAAVLFAWRLVAP